MQYYNKRLTVLCFDAVKTEFILTWKSASKFSQIASDRLSASICANVVPCFRERKNERTVKMSNVQVII
jgi:hypothetical protein